MDVVDPRAEPIRAVPPSRTSWVRSDADWDAWERPGPTPRQQRDDLWLGLGVVAGAIVATVLVNSMGAFIFGSAPSLGEQLAWVAALTAPLVVRRRYPEIVLLVVGALFIAAQARHVGDNTIPSIALFLAIYSLGAWGRHRWRARWVRVGVIGAMFVWLGVSMVRALSGSPPEFEGAAGPLDPVLASTMYTVGFNVLFFLAAYFFGTAAWVSARRRYELERQAEELRRSQAENARQAVVAERVRIARDLHDVVAHHVSVMGVQAAAARRVLDSDAELARTSLGTVEQTARTAITELRGLLGVLRAEPVGPVPTEEANGSAAAATSAPAGSPSDPSTDGHPSSPGLDQLPDLVTETRAAGLAVEYAVYGEPRPVPDAVALSAYRVVQEALTNTVKHAAATTADVRVRFLEHSLDVEVTDDGRGQAAAQGSRLGAGLGIVGMRERVKVHGGELEAGPRRGGGYLVRATFPLPADGS